jgi:hypothetical protein
LLNIKVLTFIFKPLLTEKVFSHSLEISNLKKPFFNPKDQGISLLPDKALGEGQESNGRVASPLSKLLANLQGVPSPNHILTLRRPNNAPSPEEKHLPQWLSTITFYPFEFLSDERSAGNSDIPPKGHNLENRVHR